MTQKSKSIFILLGIGILLLVATSLYFQRRNLPAPPVAQKEAEVSEKEVVLPEEEEVRKEIEKVREEIEKVREEVKQEKGIKLASCLIFEKEEYCQKGVVREEKSEVKARDPEKDELVFIREETYRYLNFSLPAGVKVYSPTPGFVRGYQFGTDPDPQKRAFIHVVHLLVPPEEDAREFVFFGLKLDPFLAAELEKTEKEEGVEVKAGQLLGVTDDTPLKYLNPSFYEDNVTFSIHVTKMNYKIVKEASVKDDHKKAVEAMEPDHTTLGIFFPYYLK